MSPWGWGCEAEGGCVCCPPAGIGMLPCVPLPLVVVCLHKCLLDHTPARCPQGRAVPPCRSLVHISHLLVLLVPAWPRPSDLTPLVRSARRPRGGSSPFPQSEGLPCKGGANSTGVCALESRGSSMSTRSGERWPMEAGERELTAFSDTKKAQATRGGALKCGGACCERVGVKAVCQDRAG